MVMEALEIRRTRVDGLGTDSPPELSAGRVNREVDRTFGREDPNRGNEGAARKNFNQSLVLLLGDEEQRI